MNHTLQLALSSYSFVLSGAPRLTANMGDLASAIAETYDLAEPRNRAVHDECAANAQVKICRANRGQTYWQLQK